MEKLKFSFIVIVVLLFIGACEKDENDVIPQIDSIAGELPLLNGDNRIGTIKGFNPSNPPETMDSIAARWNDAINAGMSVGRLQLIGLN